jgi:cytidine deaminase
MADSEEQLLAAAMAVRANAYVPYSRFPVGAAILSGSGKIYAGCDVDNASYPMTSCAEANAIGTMIAGGDRRIVSVLVIGGAAEAGDLCPPCGGCRQRLLEFSDATTTVLLADTKSIRERFTLHELMPKSFGPEQLKAKL